MVVFTCSQCGQSVKKNQVEAHCQFRCRNCQYLSCLDCGKDFWGDDYQQHFTCITEAEKYGGKDFKPKPIKNKGKQKQEQWITLIKGTLSSKKISGPLAGLLHHIIQYSNIPRKKSKFQNFIKNSVPYCKQSVMDEAWSIFEESIKKCPDAPATNAVNGTSESVKRSADDSLDERVSKKPCNRGPVCENGDVSNFDWSAAVHEILLNSSENAIPLKVQKRGVRKIQVTGKRISKVS